MRIPILVASTFLVLALSGCLATDSQGSSDSPSVGGPGRNLALIDPTQPNSPVQVREPVELVCTTPTRQDACGGFGEPTIEIAGDGTIWYSAVDSVGASPPIWLSKDGGYTFEELPFADGTGVIRDATGIEGDFAIDDAGNVYFFDILAATTYFTKYTADATHVFTLPQPQIPLVDRPWVRAGAEDEVFIFYNTGAAGTNFLRSDNGGLVWDYVNQVNFPCPLATLGQGPERDTLLLSGCTGGPELWISRDGGRSFPERIQLGLPNGTILDNYMQPSMDAAGRAYVPIQYQPDGEDYHVNAVYIVEADGTVRGPFHGTPDGALVDKSWSIAGKDGVYAMAYYIALDTTTATEADAIWTLEVSYTLNGGDEEPTWTRIQMDPGSVLQGAFGRNLGDFLQLRQTPDGDLAVSYSKRDAGGLKNYYVQTDGGIDFGPEVFRNGPSVN